MATVLFHSVLVFLAISSVQSLTADVVFNVLSLRLDYVIQKVGNMQDEINELKSNVKRLDERVEHVEKNITDIVDKLSVPKSSEISGLGIGEIEKQTKTFKRMISTEKAILRDSVKQLEKMFDEFKIEVKTQTTFSGVSTKDSIERLERSISTHREETNTKLEEIHQEIQAKQKKTDTDMSVLNTEIKTIKSETKGNSNQIEEIKADTEQNLEELKSQMLTKITNVVASVQAQKESDGTVAFAVGLNTKLSPFTNGRKIVFDKLYYSYGKGYDTSTGIFKVSKPGTYLFAYNIQPTAVAYVVNVERGPGNTNEDPRRNIRLYGSNVGIYHLLEGDRVSVETVSSVVKYQILPLKTFFSGVLVD